MRKLFIISSSFVLIFFSGAGFVMAQFGNAQSLLIQTKILINLLFPVVGGLALLYFFWGLAKFILAAGDEEAREKGKSIMIWGIVALFIIVSVWGLVAWLGTLLGIEAGSNVTIPNIVT